MRIKLLASLAFVVLLAACGNGGGSGTSSSSTGAISSAASVPTMQSSSYPGWQSYTNPSEGYAIQYPPTYALQTNVVTTTGMSTGTVIVIPNSIQPNTAFDEAKMEITSHAGVCTSVPNSVLTQTGTQITVAGTHYTVASGSDAGAGQFYLTYVYDVLQYGSCHRFTLVIHSCNLGPDCGPNHGKPLDKISIINVFEKMLSTVTFMKIPGVSTGSGSSVSTGSGSAASL